MLETRQLPHTFALAILAVVCLAIISIGIASADAGPHGGYAATTDACAACHRTHTAPGASLLNSNATGNEFCYTCHNGTGAPAVPIVSTHGNTDFSGGVEAPFSLACTQCHEPHGNPDTLYSIKEYVRVTPLITAGPVVFTATVGIDSYDDGVGSPANRLCAACHDNSANPGYPMVNHIGGENHMGSFNYTGQDCTICHAHSADNDLYTNDGFMPVGGCTDCHAAPQDNGDGLPAGGRRAIVDEFGRTSHHVQGTVEDSDCLVCHAEATGHTDGYLELWNVDTLATYRETNPGDYRAETISVADSKTLAPFCLSCHDLDGANGDTTPFSDNITPPIIDSAAWSLSAHDTGGVTNSGYGCLGCHASGHGSVNEKLLSSATVVQPFEQLCFDCHTDGMVQNYALSGSVDDIEEAFALSNRHNLGGSFTVDGNTYTLQCTTCHNPHVVTGKHWDAAAGVSPVTRPGLGTNPAANPRAMGTTLWGAAPGQKMGDFAALASGSGGWYFSTARGGVISFDQPAVYRPPKREGGTNGYDLDFDSDTMPDYPSFCLDCHTYTMGSHGPINWGQPGVSGSQSGPPSNSTWIVDPAPHGLDSANRPRYWGDVGMYGSSGNPDPIFSEPGVTRGRGAGHFMRWPYDSVDKNAGINFVMSCTDCHETHGAGARSMLRTTVNNYGAGTPIWNTMCNNCHYYYGGQHAGMSCGSAAGCHGGIDSLHRIDQTPTSGATYLWIEPSRPNYTPEITAVAGHIGSADLTVTFAESVFTTIDQTGGLTLADFVLTDIGGNNPRSITGISHTPGTATAVLTMNAPLVAADMGVDILAANGISVWGPNILCNNPPSTPDNIPCPTGPWPVTITGPPALAITQTEAITGSIRLYVTFSEPVYANNNGTGDLDLFDFVLTDSDDNRTISGVTHTAGNTTALLFLSAPVDAANDIGVDSLAAASNAIYDAFGNPATTTPVTLTAKADMPLITQVYGVDGHNRIVARFSERVYANDDATGALQPADFVYVDADGKSVTAVEHTPGSPSAALILSGDVVAAADIGVDTLAAAGDAIFDITGYPAPTTPPVTLTVGLASSIVKVEGIVGGDKLEVTFASQVYASPGETGALQAADFTLVAGGKSISSVQHAEGSPTAIITMTGILTGTDVGVATLAAATNDSIYGPSPGNFPLTTASVTINAQPAPAIAIVEGAVGYDQLFVSFTGGVYANADQSGALGTGDFSFINGNGGGAVAIIGVAHVAGNSTAVITLNAPLIAGDIGGDSIAAVNSQIFNSIANPAATTAVTITGNDCPTWGTTFPIENEPQYSATTGDTTGLLMGTVGNPTFTFPNADNDWFNGAEGQNTYIDMNNPACLMSPRSVTIEARVKPVEVDRGVGDNTFNRIFQRQANILITILNTDYRGDDIPSRYGRASIEVKYRVQSGHTCPQPQWPSDPYTGSSVWNHQISSDIDQFPIVDGHWYLIRVVFNSDKSDVGGSNGTAVDIFMDDQGPNGDDIGQNWSGYVNVTKSINESSSCRWGSLPGDVILTDYNRVSVIGAAPNHSQPFAGQIDWVTWQPIANYQGVDDSPH